MDLRYRFNFAPPAGKKNKQKENETKALNMQAVLACNQQQLFLLLLMVFAKPLGPLCASCKRSPAPAGHHNDKSLLYSVYISRHCLRMQTIVSTKHDAAKYRPNVSIINMQENQPIANSITFKLFLAFLRHFIQLVYSLLFSLISIYIVTNQ